MMDFAVVVALLLFMLTYLVLLAALAAKMRSSTFQRTSYQTRVEARWIPGQVFYFLFLGFMGVSVLIFHWKMFYTQSLGESFQRLQVTNNVKGASYHTGHLLFGTLCFFFFSFFFFACLNIQNTKLSKLEVCNLVLPWGSFPFQHQSIVC